jgi:hypothetical protein
MTKSDLDEISRRASEADHEHDHGDRDRAALLALGVCRQDIPALVAHLGYLGRQNAILRGRVEAMERQLAGQSTAILPAQVHG